MSAGELRGLLLKCFGRKVPSHDFDDIFQEVMVGLLVALARGQVIESVRALAVTLFHRRWRDLLRRTRRMPTAADAVEDVEAATSPTSESLLALGLWVHTQSCLKGLGSRQRALLEWVVAGGALRGYAAHAGLPLGDVNRIADGLVARLLHV